MNTPVGTPTPAASVPTPRRIRLRASEIEMQ